MQILILNPNDFQQKQQISPAFGFDEEHRKIIVKKDIFELCFPMTLGPMEAASLKIVKSTSLSKAEIKTNDPNLQMWEFRFLGIRKFCFFRDSTFKSSTSSGDFIVQNDKVKAEFDGENGMIKVRILN